MPAIKDWSFLTGESSVYSQTEGHGKPGNLDDFAAVSRGILQTGLRNLAKFSSENCEP